MDCPWDTILLSDRNMSIKVDEDELNTLLTIYDELNTLLTIYSENNCNFVEVAENARNANLCRL